MRGDRRHDQLMPFPALNELTRHLQRFFEELRVRCREFHDSLGTNRAHADLGSGFGNMVFEIIHIGKAGDTRADHFGAGKLGAQLDEVRGHKFTLHRHHVAHQPDIQAQVIRQTA